MTNLLSMMIVDDFEMEKMKAKVVNDDDDIDVDEEEGKEHLSWEESSDCRLGWDKIVLENMIHEPG